MVLIVVATVERGRRQTGDDGSCVSGVDGAGSADGSRQQAWLTRKESEISRKYKYGKEKSGVQNG